jgi:hypothetical protein
LLVNIITIYASNDKKYRGKKYNILDIKLQVFFDCYTKVGLANNKFHLAFFIMLKGRASVFYYNKISRQLYNFTIIVKMTKTYFKIKERRQKYLIK